MTQKPPGQGRRTDGWMDRLGRRSGICSHTALLHFSFSKLIFFLFFIDFFFFLTFLQNWIPTHQPYQDEERANEAKRSEREKEEEKQSPLWSKASLLPTFYIYSPCMYAALLYASALLFSFSAVPTYFYFLVSTLLLLLPLLLLVLLFFLPLFMVSGVVWACTIDSSCLSRTEHRWMDDGWRPSGAALCSVARHQFTIEFSTCLPACLPLRLRCAKSDELTVLSSCLSFSSLSKIIISPSPPHQPKSTSEERSQGTNRIGRSLSSRRDPAQKTSRPPAQAQAPFFLSFFLSFFLPFPAYTATCMHA
ncbi:hypothetical protein BKA80DRAFT_37352 [Phyllosticta citrichinensis]